MQKIYRVHATVIVSVITDVLAESLVDAECTASMREVRFADADLAREWVMESYDDLEVDHTERLVNEEPKAEGQHGISRKVRH